MVLKVPLVCYKTNTRIPVCVCATYVQSTHRHTYIYIRSICKELVAVHVASAAAAAVVAIVAALVANPWYEFRMSAFSCV